MTEQQLLLKEEKEPKQQALPFEDHWITKMLAPIDPKHFKKKTYNEAKRLGIA